MKKIILLVILAFHVMAGIAQNDYKVNDRVEVLYQGKWYKATVLKAEKNKFYVHWDGYSSSYDSWAKPEEIRLPQSNSTTTNTNSSSNGNSMPATAKYKVGDKVVYFVNEFPEGTITGYKNGYYLLDITDPVYKDQGKQGIEEKWLIEPWTYRTFYDEMKQFFKRSNNNLNDLAAFACGECTPSGFKRDEPSEVNMEMVNRAKKDFADFKAWANKYPTVPNTGKNYFTLNPALVKKAAAKADSVLALWVGLASSERINKWKALHGTFCDLTADSEGPEHTLANGRYAEDYVMCGSYSDIKPVLIQNINALFTKFGISGNAEDFLKGMDENFAKRKSEIMAEADNNAWIKTDYPNADATFNSQIQKESSSNLTVKKTFFNTTTFQVNKDDYGYITEQTKGGVVIYQKQGCDYWMYQYITVFKPYKGNGTYGVPQIRFMDYGYIKPF